MSKEQESFDRIKLFIDHMNDDFDSEDVSAVDNALQRLEAIDNANPSEALVRLEQFLNEMTYCLEHPKEYVKGYEKQIFWKYKNTLETTIKQALLKQQELPEPFKTGVDIGVIKPKQYLKWEDLEKDRTYKVLLNGIQYELVKRYDDYEYRCDYITLQKESNVSIYIYEYEKEIFNDLRLERVEE